MKRIIRISNDGKDVTFLYGDALQSLCDLGETTIKRATDVRFDNTKKQWKVQFVLPKIHGEQVENESFCTRKKAINAEEIVLNRQLNGSRIDL